jgi:1,2-diacylglycerol 3-beta-galactosyltransferase
LPVASRFCQPLGNRRRLQADLGWPEDRPVVLVVGGGEGMGPLFETARAIARSGVRAALAIVSGRNAALRRRLEQVEWEIPTWVYGFEQRMPSMMQGDHPVTKAGPSSIAEAANAGLPVVLAAAFRGRKKATSNTSSPGPGAWVRRRPPSPFGRCWESGRLERAAACRRGRPHAAAEVATPLPSAWGIGSPALRRPRCRRRACRSIRRPAR